MHSNYKIVIIGDISVGKSSIFGKYTENNGKYISTIGIDFKIKEIEVNDKIHKLLIWDTSGQENFILYLDAIIEVLKLLL